MRVSLDLRKTLEQNAAAYYEKAKKARKKREGALKIIAALKGRVQEEEEKARQEAQAAAVEASKPKQKLEWFERFRWFISSEGFLCVGGKDQTTNDILIKKHLEEGDIVFHTDLAGSPFVIVKDGKKCGKKTREETAQFCACFSRAWKSGLGSAEVYGVDSEQVSKEPIKKGTFMVYGKRDYYDAKMELAFGNKEGKAFIGPPSAVIAHCPDHMLVVQGNDKKSDVVRKLSRQFKLESDAIMSVLPTDCSLKKPRK